MKVAATTQRLTLDSRQKKKSFFARKSFIPLCSSAKRKGLLGKEEMTSRNRKTTNIKLKTKGNEVKDKTKNKKSKPKKSNDEISREVGRLFPGTIAALRMAQDTLQSVDTSPFTKNQWFSLTVKFMREIVSIGRALTLDDVSDLWRIIMQTEHLMKDLFKELPKIEKRRRAIEMVALAMVWKAAAAKTSKAKKEKGRRCSRK